MTTFILTHNYDFVKIFWYFYTYIRDDALVLLFAVVFFLLKFLAQDSTIASLGAASQFDSASRLTLGQHRSRMTAGGHSIILIIKKGAPCGAPFFIDV